MEEDLKKEDAALRIKNRLQIDNVKLWLAPYYDGENKGIEELKMTGEILKLVEKYHVALNLDVQLCAELLLDMQKMSLQRLKEREQFKSKGLATLRIKVSGKQIPEFSLQTELSRLVENLKSEIGEQVGVSTERLKFISGGKVLQYEKTMEEQALKHGSIILVLVLPPTTAEDMDVATDESILQETKKDIEFLTNKRVKKQYLSVTNQHGHFLDIPKESQVALVTGMALHEKGHTAFKRSQYSLALLFYLEAENEFKSCSSGILDKVDNFALLNLDIVWCYLHLQSFQYLADAESRLKICETTFLRTYGENMERVSLVKGTSGNENVLMMRLHLLKAILYHLQNKREDALSTFNKVESEIKRLKIDEDKVADLIGLGYSQTEARTGLRAAGNDLNVAVNYILNIREQEREMADLDRIKRLSDYHICPNGNAVNPELVKQMVSMGFSQLIAMQALKVTSNNLNTALIWIREFEKKLKAKYPSFVVDVLMTINVRKTVVQSVIKKYKYILDDNCVKELIMCGIGKDETKAMLIRMNLENLEKSDSATNSSSTTPFPEIPSCISSFTAINGTSLDNAISSLPGTSTQEDAALSEDDSSEEERALKRLKDDMAENADEYLDTTLEAEEKFFKLYKSFLN